MVGVLLALGFLGFDVSRPPPEQVSTAVVLSAIDLYQATLSGRIGVHCRFHPSCSRYTEGALARFGLLRGSWLGLTRIVRCGPWTAAGTSDPVPPNGEAESPSS